MLTTYTFWNDWLNCQEKTKKRYFDHLVPIERDRNLSFGSVIHDCLEAWHRERDLPVVLDIIDRAYPNRRADADQNAMWHKATAMMTTYASVYDKEDFEVIALEKTFEGPIINPKTNNASRFFRLGGKIDGIVWLDGQYFLLEHKTASQINAAYIERLWSDFQIILYSIYASRLLEKPIAGVIYNILTKPKLQQGKGETEKEYEARKAGLIAKSKTGKTSAKRKMPESDDDYQFRLQMKLLKPDMFHREVLYISQERYQEVLANLWELTISLREALRRDAFTRNTSHCFRYNKPCAYYPLCSSSDNPIVRENFYTTKAPHEELRCG